jgi:uncharacterized protein (TIGR03067 family)
MKGILLAVAATAALATADGPDASARAEEQKLAGTWQADSITVNGNPMAAGEAQNTRLRLGEGKFAQEYAGRRLRQGKLLIDPTKELKWIEFSYTGDDGKTENMLGIYDLKGDSLKICLARPDVPRPTEFVSKPDTGHILTTYQREKR